MSIDSIKARIEAVIFQYNADNDSIPNGPIVTWADQRILEILDLLIDEVERLSNQAYQSQRNPENRPQFLAENGAPAETHQGFFDKGEAVYEEAIGRLGDIQLVDNLNFEADEARTAIDAIIAEAIHKMEVREEPSNAQKAHLFEEYFEWIIGAPAVVVFSLVQHAMENYGSVFCQRWAKDANVDLENFNLIREGINNYLENKE